MIEPSVIGTNYKVSTLHHLMQQVKHDYVVITDSDVSVEPDYLSTIIPPLMSPDVGLVTCVYRAGVIQPFPALLESLMINTSFTTQVIVASQVEQPAYAFGATMALKRSSLEAIGGFAALCDYLADDYYLGFLIAQAGYKVRILPAVVETHPDAGSLKDLYDGDAKDFVAASLYHFLGWVFGAVEIYVFFALIGTEASWMDALIIESMIQPITAAALIIPGALGVREVGGVFLCGLLGIGEGAGLTLMVLKRAREAVYNMVGLFVLARAGYSFFPQKVSAS